MRGHLRQHRRGTWELIVEIGRDPLTGKRRQRSRTVHGTKREAERELRSLISDVELGRHTGSELSLHGLLEHWLDLVAEELSPTTLREYRRLIAKRIEPSLGRTPVTKLTTPMLDEFYQALSRDAGLAPASVRQVHSVIRRGLRQGVRWGWIEHNAAANASPPTVRRKDIHPPSTQDIKQLVIEADQRDPAFGVLVRVAIATGMRRGELCGLQWPDLDHRGAKLRVERSVVAVPNGTAIKSTKSGTVRRLSLDVHTLKALAEHHALQTQRAQLNGAELAPAAFVFSHALDCSRPLHPDNVTAGFRRLPSNDSVRFHDLRHAHATLLIGNGVDINTVSGRLGHANTSTTLNIYAHVLDENDQDAADLMGNLLSD